MEIGTRAMLCRGLAALCLCTFLVGERAEAGDASHPIIAGYGAIQPGQVGENAPDPSLRYRVVFEISKAASDPAAVNHSLDRLARFMNLLGASGIRPAPGEVLAIVYGPATLSLLNDAAYQAHFARANPNLELLQSLLRAGVGIHVCGYAMAAHKVAQDEIAPGITKDVAAMLTLANLQLRGWAVIAD